MSQTLQICEPSIPHDVSIKWVLQNPQLLSLQRPIKFKDFADVLSKKPLADEFKILEFMTQTTQHVSKLYDSPDQFSFNRYSQFLTFSHSMVKLAQQVYINANLIKTIVKNAPPIIATQGPLSTTINHFWQMVAETNVTTIIMLCGLEEKHKVKCFRYWPASLENPEFVLGAWTVKLLSCDEIMPNLIKREFKLIKQGGDQRVVCQYQWKDWPDKQAPKEWEPVSLLTHIAASKLINKQSLLTHCSAGVGRTGTFIGLVNMEVLLRYYQAKRDQAEEDSDQELEPAISIFSIVRKMREQRWGMVHRFQQYEFLYKYFAKELELRFPELTKAIDI